MLGKLARWLRMLGYDALYGRQLTDSHLIRLSVSEDRIVLTRHRELAKRVPGGRSVLINSTGVLEQLKELSAKLQLRPHFRSSRCSLCNLLLKNVGREELGGRAPPYVLATQDEFRECPGCGRIYWKGTHWNRIVRDLRSVGLLNA